jgi:hypothetical protein
MKHLKRTVLSLTYCLFMGFSGLIAKASSSVICPEITFTYDWRSHVRDVVASFYYKTPVTEQIRRQLDIQLPMFRAAWNKDGSHWFLIFGLRRYCEPEQWILSAKPISREDNFTSCVFHELLHVWVDENIEKDRSHLLKKYSNEDYHAREHLHLMALQKMVYLKIDRKDILDVLDEGYRKLEWSPAYCCVSSMA